MEDYVSSLVAKRIEEKLVGALIYTAPNNLSAEQKAFVREEIGATSLGQGIKIISHFDTLAQLRAAVPNPAPGDAYSVGTALPYNLYAYDLFLGNWRNYGPIRANDIAARFAQNVVVASSAWTQDTTVFADFTWKASIPLAEVTGNDFPIVGFNPTEAGSGNFAALAYAFDGRVEIWAKSKPTSGITIPTITFIIQDTGDTTTGNSTKGITNASVGVGIGGVTTDMLGPSVVTTVKIANTAVTRAKLANDALFSPIRRIGTSNTEYHPVAGDLGMTYITVGNNVSYNINFTEDVSKQFANGSELAVAFCWGNGVNINCIGDNVVFMTPGESGQMRNITLAITERYGMAALKLVNIQSGVYYWLVTGNVEVV